ncbi:hypothetical protein Q7689_07840 [Nocardiopsis tropica]|uniref:hypothetical protein n=1 Tax=Nocardiopsis tropica TaxID=109330 RepID=UPI002E8C2B45|nr:hypothetical protein [Nocardiopsis tropica]
MRRLFRSGTVLDRARTEIHTGVKFRRGSPWEWPHLVAVLSDGLARVPGSTPRVGRGSTVAPELSRAGLGDARVGAR